MNLSTTQKRIIIELIKDKFHMNKEMKFSEKYYRDLNLSPYQHYINNVWFINTLDKLKDTGKLFIPDLNKTFNKMGDEIE